MLSSPLTCSWVMIHATDWLFPPEVTKDNRALKPMIPASLVPFTDRPWIQGGLCWNQHTNHTNVTLFWSSLLYIVSPGPQIPPQPISSEAGECFTTPQQCLVALPALFHCFTSSRGEGDNFFILQVLDWKQGDPSSDSHSARSFGVDLGHSLSLSLTLQGC